MAPSWRRWTPLRRCGCRSGNMKKTEHVPSTGRPSSRGPGPAISPRTAIKLPPRHAVGDSCTYHVPGTSASRAIILPLYSSFQRNAHVDVWLFPYLPSFCSFHRLLVLLLLLWGGSTRPSPKTGGPAGYVRGQRLALWALTAGLTTFIRPTSKYWYCSPAYEIPARCRI